MRLRGLLASVILCGGLLASQPPSNYLSKLPLRFEQASGDTYVARGPGYSFAIRAGGNLLSWRDKATGVNASVSTRFLHARDAARLEPLDPLVTRTNYFTGGPSSNWRTDVANYGKVRVTGLYQGVDLVFYGSAGQLEYDFVVHPGADPRAIQFDVTGADSVRIDAEGNLVLSAGGRAVRWNAPVIYQANGAYRSRVNGRFQVSGRRVSFRVDAYDRSRDLVIDPVLSYATYFGGSGNEAPWSMAADGAGNVYVVGTTSSGNLSVTSGASQTAYGGETSDDFTGDAFVAKFSPAGALLYLTFLGGTQDELGNGIAVDAAGNAYVTGMTNSPNFPTTDGALRKTFAGGGGNSCERAGDAFVTKLNPSGSQLIYSTYLGGSHDDVGYGIAIDAGGNAYVTGFTISIDFPTTSGAYQTTFKGLGGQLGKPYCGGSPWFNTGDAFVAKLNPAGTQLVFSTFLGGTSDDFGTAIALDSAQNVFVAGFTLSRNFPVTSGALQSTFGGTEIQNEFWTTGDGFVAKLNASGASLIYSTYLGGSGDENILGIAAAKDGTLWLTGNTSSQNFPVTSNAVQKTYGGYLQLPFVVEQLTGDAFVAHLNATGSALLYSTYLGGNQNDVGMSIALDATGVVYVGGFSDSRNFPMTSGAVQKTWGGDRGQGQYFQFGDGFVTVIDPLTGQLLYSTYFGGSLDDLITGVVPDGAGGVWATGTTLSTDLPVTAGAIQKSFNGNKTSNGIKGDGLLVHYTGLTALAITTGSTLPGGTVGVAYSQTLTVVSGQAPYSWSLSSGSLPAGLTLSAAGAITGTPSAPGTATFSVKVTDNSGASVTQSLTLTIAPAAGAPSITGVVNGASFAPAGLAPGLIFTIAGTHMGPTSGVTLALDSNNRIATTLAGVQVLVDGVPAPLLYVSDVQINAVAPYELASKVGQSVNVQAVYQQVPGGILTVPVVAVAPAIFPLGNGQGAIRNQDNSVNGTANPATRGSIVSIYATGEGQLNPAGVDGQLVSDTNTHPVGAVTVTIGGLPAQLQFQGATAFDGFLQINAIVPLQVAAGTVPVVITVSGVSSPTGTTMVVQ